MTIATSEPTTARPAFFDKYLSLIITSILSLAAVAVSLIQIYDAKATRQAELERQQTQYDQSRQTEQDREVRELNIRLANFISENQAKVFSKDEVDRERMRELILAAFPPDSANKVFVRLMAVTSDETIKQNWREGATKAESLAGGERDRLIGDMFSGDKNTRIAATTEVFRNWGDDSELVSRAVDYAANNRGNKSGVINTLTVLQSAPAEVLRANREQIAALLDAVRGNGSQTADLVDKVRARMDSPVNTGFER